MTVNELMELLGISEDEARAECRCEHPRWEHHEGTGECFFTYHTGDYGEHSIDCGCWIFGER